MGGSAILASFDSICSRPMISSALVAVLFIRRRLIIPIPLLPSVLILLSSVLSLFFGESFQSDVDLVQQTLVDPRARFVDLVPEGLAAVFFVRRSVCRGGVGGFSLRPLDFTLNPQRLLQLRLQDTGLAKPIQLFAGLALTEPLREG